MVFQMCDTRVPSLPESEDTDPFHLNENKREKRVLMGDKRRYMSIFTEPFLELHFGMDTWQHKPDFLCKITATVIWVHKCSQGDQAWVYCKCSRKRT